MFDLARGAVRIEGLRARPLSVPLREPFVIASGRVDATHCAEIEVRLAWGGRTADGLGEAACLPPVTREDQGDVLAAVERVTPALVGRDLPPRVEALAEALASALDDTPVTRAGVEAAVLDAMARIAGLPLRAALGGAGTDTLETDITIPIAAPEAMAAQAAEWARRGFRALKIKVGRDLDRDLRALEAVARAAPDATLRVDANAGYSVGEALAMIDACRHHAIPVECWEQPCAVGDWDGLARVVAAADAPVIADESVRSLADVSELVRHGFSGGVNLKLAKLGGILSAQGVAAAARGAGLSLMIGGMVETRLGMSAAAHLACALGGLEFVDLDTAWLLADDPYEGGYVAEGPRYTIPSDPGVGVRRRAVL
jgi:L-alanine-DL-glutamate epimerase-like enolase superfamily enzyme